MKRSVLRWIHLIFAIPIIGYIYSPFAELPNYAPVVRYIAFPVILLSGLWMYAGVFFAVIGVAGWLGACQLFGYWSGDPEFGRATRRAEGLVNSSCATVNGIELIQRVNRPSRKSALLYKVAGCRQLELVRC